MDELPICQQLERYRQAILDEGEGLRVGPLMLNEALEKAAALIRAQHEELVEAVRIIRKHVPIEALGMNSMGDGDIPGHFISWFVLEEHLHYMDAALAKAREA